MQHFILEFYCSDNCTYDYIETLSIQYKSLEDLELDLLEAVESHLKRYQSISEKIKEMERECATLNNMDSTESEILFAIQQQITKLYTLRFKPAEDSLLAKLRISPSRFVKTDDEGKLWYDAPSIYSLEEWLQRSSVLKVI